jgi:hypothetical protein
MSMLHVHCPGSCCISRSMLQVRSMLHDQVLAGVQVNAACALPCSCWMNKNNNPMVCSYCIFRSGFLQDGGSEKISIFPLSGRRGGGGHRIYCLSPLSERENNMQFLWGGGSDGGHRRPPSRSLWRLFMKLELAQESHIGDTKKTVHRQLGLAIFRLVNPEAKKHFYGLVHV